MLLCSNFFRQFCLELNGLAVKLQVIIFLVFLYCIREETSLVLQGAEFAVLSSKFIRIDLCGGLRKEVFRALKTSGK